MTRRNLMFLPLLVLLAAFGCAGEEDKFTKTASGLKYLDLTEGTGDEVKSGDWVKVHYTGTLRRDGTEFDSIIKRGEPAVFKVGVGKLIKGWDEGIPGMKVGGKRKLIVPAALAYGQHARPKIPANSELVFEVEVLGTYKVKITDLVEGKGPPVGNNDTVSVHYTGRLASNKVQFDSSRGKRPLEVTIGRGEVIPGWEDGLVGMRVGGKRKLEIPAELGYGAKGFPPDIPPDADLEFEVELVSSR